MTVVLCPSRTFASLSVLQNEPMTSLPPAVASKRGPHCSWTLSVSFSLPVSHPDSMDPVFHAKKGAEKKQGSMKEVIFPVWQKRYSQCAAILKCRHFLLASLQLFKVSFHLLANHLLQPTNDSHVGCLLKGWMCHCLSHVLQDDAGFWTSSSLFRLVGFSPLQQAVLP